MTCENHEKNDFRIELLEKSNQETTKLLHETQIEVMKNTMEIKDLKIGQGELKTMIEKLTEQVSLIVSLPAKRYELIVTSAIVALVSGGIGAAIGSIISKG